MNQLPGELIRDLAWLFRYRPHVFALLMAQIRCVRVRYRTEPDFVPEEVEAGDR